MNLREGTVKITDSTFTTVLISAEEQIPPLSKEDDFGILSIETISMPPQDEEMSEWRILDFVMFCKYILFLYTWS